MASSVLKLVDGDDNPMDFRFDFEATEGISPATESIFTLSEEDQRRQYEASHPELLEATRAETDRIEVTNGVLVGIGLDLTDVTPSLLARHAGAKVHTVDFSHNLLTKLNNLPIFASLTTLNLDNNFITELSPLPACPHLDTLLLNNNRICSVDPLLSTIKVQYSKLIYLSLLGNLACPNELVDKDDDDYKRYRLYLIHVLPTLKYLDSRNVNHMERQLAQQNGAFLKVIKFTESDLACQASASASASTSSSSTLDSGYHPLRKDLDKQEARATIGTTRYVYYGKHSEGNRFIRNDDL